ncbi:PTS glucose transporter subunit IIA [Bacillaceae bacterium SIJ1]|uniref:PTS sugar transporter subunit IIA n=1 Tax=Litoribacterium kuwaitense TaxID=1398745 RepID=UPI0013EC74BB|nr:PTS glucose transporter subunit IIA [Litoribacterium kuwaitense]NGP45888.1 PTS glucose transporter subunit IIA [Litoribacterium kuwaitense]
MFANLFGRTKADHVLAPMTGEIVPLESLSDPKFSQKMMGDGVAIQPDDGFVVSPVDGKVTELYMTHHAFVIKSKSGIEYLIHVGLDTVFLNGEGFTAHVIKGDRVSAGDLILTVDLALVKKKAESTVSPIVVATEVKKLIGHIGQKVTRGETEMMYVEK